MRVRATLVSVWNRYHGEGPLARMSADGMTRQHNGAWRASAICVGPSWRGSIADQPRVARHCNRELVIRRHEDGRYRREPGRDHAGATFESLHALVQVIGALDTPAPYSPPPEDVFLRGEVEIETRVAPAGEFPSYRCRV